MAPSVGSAVTSTAQLVSGPVAVIVAVLLAVPACFLSYSFSWPCSFSPRDSETSSLELLVGHPTNKSNLNYTP